GLPESSLRSAGTRRTSNRRAEWADLERHAARREHRPRAPWIARRRNPQLPIRELQPLQSPVLRPKINWKLVVDGFLETWHIPFVHRTAVSQIFIPSICAVDAFGPNLRVVYPRKSFLKLRDQDENRWNLLSHSLVLYLLFPNVLLIWQGDHLEIWRVFPDP